MKILRLIFDGFNSKESRFAHCVLLINEVLFTIPTVYEIASKHNYPVCSEIKIDQLIESRCLEAEEDFVVAYRDAKNHGHSFNIFPDNSSALNNPFKAPRFSEKDFEQILVGLGGFKIPESTNETPDFFLDDIVIELKDLQTDSLMVKERQQSIGEIFKDFKAFTINLDPKADYGELTKEYHQKISNTIRKHFKKASSQIKSFKQSNDFNSCGIIILNTGMFSLPHEMLKSVAEDILNRQTKTIQFAFLLSQMMQTNGFDLYAVVQNEFIGKVPTQIAGLKEKVLEYMDRKMTEMVLGTYTATDIQSMQPISFLSGDKIFYWNPGRVKDSRNG